VSGDLSSIRTTEIVEQGHKALPALVSQGHQQGRGPAFPLQLRQSLTPMPLKIHTVSIKANTDSALRRIVVIIPASPAQTAFVGVLHQQTCRLG
jgi:hypothetical protein